MFKINDKVNVEHIDGPLPCPCRNYQAKIIKANDDGKCFIVKGYNEKAIFVFAEELTLVEEEIA